MSRRITHSWANPSSTTRRDDLLMMLRKAQHVQVPHPKDSIMADRENFALSEGAAAEWEAINSRPARELPGLRALMARPSPFHE